MTDYIAQRKAAVKYQFNQYLEATHQYAEQNHMGFLERMVGGNKLEEVKSDMEQQAETVIDCAADIAVNDTDPSTYHATFLDSNPFYQHYNGGREYELRNYLTDHFDTVTADIASLFEADVNESVFPDLDGGQHLIADEATDIFDATMRESYPDRDDAEQVLEDNLQYAREIDRRGYTDEMPVIDTGMLSRFVPSFADKVMPIIEDAENWVWKEHIQDDLDRIYDEVQR